MASTADAAAYATAISEAAADPAAQLAELEQLTEILNRLPLLKQLLVDAAVRPAADRDRTLARYLTAFTPATRQLVGVMVSHRAIDLLPTIVVQLQTLLARRGAGRRVTVETPGPLSAEVRQQLIDRFTEAGRQPGLTVVRRPRLIGGLRIIVDDQVIDSSLAGSLERLRGVLSYG